MDHSETSGAFISLVKKGAKSFDNWTHPVSHRCCSANDTLALDNSPNKSAVGVARRTTHSKVEEIWRFGHSNNVTSSTNEKIGARFETMRQTTVFANVNFETRRWESSRARHQGHCDELVGHPAGLKAPASFRPTEGTVLVHPPPRA